MTQWVSFQDLKQQVSIVDVLAHYDLLEALHPQRGGEELVGLCPFHEESRGSFHVSTAKNAWNCFGCHRHGNILDFVSAKETVDIRQAAMMIQGWFQVSAVKKVQSIPKTSETQGAVSESKVPTNEEAGDENPILTFELKNLDSKHPYLKERGLEKETIDHFGLGYCSRGLLKSRVAIPIHNGRGELVAYAGRWPGDDGWPEGEDKYKLPGGFLKSHVVFNLNRVGELAREKRLILVEGFFSSFRIHQVGIPNVVALMGSYLSESQRDLIVESVGPQGRIMLLFDNDEAGRECEARCLQELGLHLYVKVVRLPERYQQPDNLTDREIRQLLTG